MVIDYPYFVFIAILLCFVWCEYYYGNNKFLFNLSCIVTLVFVGFRAPTVGADTWNYCYYYLNGKGYYLYREEVESLFYAYAKFASIIFAKNVTLFMLCNTVLSLSPIYYLIKKYSAKPCLSVALFFLIFRYPVYFIALRQILAMAIGFWAFLYFYEGRKWRWAVYIVLSIIAYYMHRSTIINQIILILVSYLMPLRSKKLVYMTIYLSLIAGVILQAFNVQQILDLLVAYNLSPSERLTSYYEYDLQTYAISPSLIAPSIIANFVFYYMPKEKMDLPLAKLYFVGVVVANLFFQVTMFGRMSAFLTIFSIIVFTWVFYTTHKKGQYFKYSYILILLYLTLTYAKDNMNYDKEASSRMHPYHFIFEDYSTVDWPKLRNDNAK